MRIISISGLDGSGKSTQIKLLKEYLESQGLQIFYFHAIKFGIAQKIKELRQEYCPICLILKHCKTPKEESVTKSRKIGITLRKMFLRIDISRFEKLVKKLEKEGFDYLLTDRYFYDRVVNIEYLSFPKVSPWKNPIRKPDLAIYLEADPEIIIKRERKPDQGIEYLKKKKEIFDKHASKWNLKIIDGNRAKEKIFEEIKNALESI